MKRFGICECFYTNNFFIKKYNLHTTYFSKRDFITEYEELLQSRGCTDLTEVIDEIEEELDRRKLRHKNNYENKKLIEEKYKRLNPSIFNFLDSFLEPNFIDFVNDAKENKLEDVLKMESLSKHNQQIYSTPAFTPKFCKMFIDELKHFEKWDVPKSRPNTMNKYGIDLSELGFTEFIKEFIDRHVSTLTRIFYPDYGGDDIDSFKAFIVKYKVGEDVDLSYHYDNAELTFNISLNEDYFDGDLYFGPMRGSESSIKTGYSHQLGHMLLHRGQQMHGAFPITEGERYNLIVWMRSSKIRNKLCPMCDEVPKIVSVQHGYGDGFTYEDVNMCTAL